MSVMTIAAVGGAIATGFYFINKDTAPSKKKLRESTAMVFAMSTGVMLLARFMGLGDPPAEVGPTKAGAGSLSLGGAPPAAPLDYIISGEPPF